MKKLINLLILLVACTILFTACNEAEGESEIQAFAGFIKIDDNILHITPVDVFVTFPFEFVGRAATFIYYDDAATMAEFGLTHYDFPSGIHIRPNWNSDMGWHYVEAAGIDTLSFEIAGDAQFIIRGETINRFVFNAGDADILDEILPQLYPTVVHFIEVQNGQVIRLVQEFIFTQ